MNIFGASLALTSLSSVLVATASSRSGNSPTVSGATAIAVPAELVMTRQDRRDIAATRRDYRVAAAARQAAAAKAAAARAAAAKAAALRAAAARRAVARAAAARARASRSVARVPIASGDPRGIALDMLPSFGWSAAAEFPCLDSLWLRESGWRVNAANASGAYGIPQALPGSKMAAYGADWQTDPRTQITWGLHYIQGRYGSPCGAWSHFQTNGWY